MDSPPPGVDRRPRGGGGGGRWAAAVAGLVVGLGLLAVVAWAVAGRGEDEADPQALSAPTGTGPPPKQVLRIVFPEGFTRAQMAARITAVRKIAERKYGVTPKLTAKGYLAATKAVHLPPGFKGTKTDRMEGFLFPATYEFTEDTTAKQFVALQLAAFERAWKGVDLAYAKSKNLTPYDVLVIASMVEKEVQVPKERKLVAAVIYNRLHVGLALGIDATIRYGRDIPPTEPIHQSDLDSDTPYNTRRFPGLPPTPIANPGLASIEAAAHPARVDYLYFVRKADCKSHFFTASEQKFLDYPRAGLQC